MLYGVTRPHRTLYINVDPDLRRNMPSLAYNEKNTFKRISSDLYKIYILYSTIDIHFKCIARSLVTGSAITFDICGVTHPSSILIYFYWTEMSPLSRHRGDISDSMPPQSIYHLCNIYTHTHMSCTVYIKRATHIYIYSIATKQSTTKCVPILWDTMCLIKYTHLLLCFVSPWLYYEIVADSCVLFSHIIQSFVAETGILT